MSKVSSHFDLADSSFIFISCFLLLVSSTHPQTFTPTLTYNILEKNMSSYTSQQIIFEYEAQKTYQTEIMQNETFMVVVYTKLFSDSQQLFQLTDSITIRYSQSIRIKKVIYNFQNKMMTISVNLTYQEKTYVYNRPYFPIKNNQDGFLAAYQVELDVLKLILSSFSTNMHQGQVYLENHFLAIIQKQKTANYMLPFNLISQKKYKVFVNYFDSGIQRTSYLNQPFLPTFWNQLGIEAITIPWLPYFSECTGSKRRILLEQLLQPTKCTNRQDGQKRGLSSFFTQILCQTKVQNFQCLIEEYSVTNKKRQYWFHSTSKDIFYFHPYSIATSQLQNYLQNSGNIQQISKLMYQQIPVLVTKRINIRERPKEFIFRFNMALNDKLSAQIISVSLQVNAERTVPINSSTKAQQNNYEDQMVSLQVIVNYLTDQQRFYNLHFGYAYYLSIPVAITFFIYILSRVLSRYNGMYKNFQTRKLVHLIMVPLLKGLCLSSVTMFCFMVFFYVISKSSRFQIIATTFNGDDSIQSDLYRKYNGRNGVTLIITGFFILVHTIRQTFKIPTPEQMKINIEDAEEQSNEISGFSGQSEKNTATETHTKSHFQRDINFSIMTLKSRRNKIFLEFSCILLTLEYNFKFSSLETNKFIQVLLWVVVLPIILTILYKIQCYLILRDLMYAKAGLIISQTHFFCTIILKTDTLIDFVFYLAVVTLSFSVLMPFYQIKLNHFFTNLSNEQKPNKIQVFILRNFKDYIKYQSKLSYYERGVYFSSVLISQLCSIILSPFMFLLLNWSFEESKIFSDIFVNSYNFKIIVMMSVLLIPTIIFVQLCIIEWYDKVYDLGIFKIIELNHFNFKNRKVKWMSDIFRQNTTIANFLKQYQNFHYSSQLYFILFSLSFSGISFILGFKIIFQNQYICFMDPALTVIFLIVWVVGDILAIMISFLALKLKFYEKKQQVRMRTKLQTIEKFLRKKEYTKYLQLNAVKEYFLYNYRDWVVRNVENILTKSMFLQQDGKILKKFKFYKNLLKRKNIMMRRNSFVEGNRKLLDLQKQNQQLSKWSQKQLNNEQSHHQFQGSSKRVRTNPRLLSKSHSPSIQEPKVIKISKQKFNQLAKPLLYYWFYTAKQNTLLKSLVVKIKEQKLQEVCEFCNMDLDLQNIEKHDIQEIINQYRVVNVGKEFVPRNFVQYYRTYQEFITVCFECKEKKLYLQKKRIKNIKFAKIIIMNWLIKCRGNMMQRKHIQLNTGQLYQ